MSQKTRATEMLDISAVAYSLHSYDYNPGADRIGVQAAVALGVPAGQVLKTLMVVIDNKPACAVVPSDCELSMKKLAAALGGKSAQMMKPADAERITGFKVGGISPFGQKRDVPTVLEERALVLESVFVNGGQRGLQIKLDPKRIVLVLNAKVASLIASA
ncbi:ybaK/ebsC protein [Hyphomicrobium denitrificans 1NES1]|uniref:Cys-tRNA(Pro)/Cys-tRNA(Cys) deacylase n=1 Tax=Hyphomicrobium denitrificans 1NES1 TaxID=670307 RepID=N0B6C6_9HYPH|nr:Cys-tRNA(Pro) deacylase [Hyphomicrobium denitrificans]AGK58538.1 ybaK/ebsC protein [Hyphomicrobium denitrificans 1NES1]